MTGSVTVRAGEHLDATELRGLLIARESDGTELAVLDVRDEGPFSRGHILLSVPAPADQVEVRVPEVVPRTGVPIVLVDGDGAADGDAELARSRLRAIGYDDVAVLAGGVTGWSAAGHELVTGTNAVTKAFGEAVEEVYGTPRRPAAEIAAMIGKDPAPVVLDSRPPVEFARMSIPGAINCAGAELAHRIDVAAPDGAVPVVVNCAGRTRSIMGAQSLINSGVAHDVVALENGTMGWQLAGLELDHGRSAHVPAPAPDDAGARARADRVRHLFGVSVVDRPTVERWRADDDRTLFVLDVRTAAEYEAGHLRGARHAAGGQVVQALDDYVGVWGSRVVLVDTAPGTRALMTASWLAQIGLVEPHVLVAGEDDLTASAESPTAGVRADDLAARLDDTLVLDLADSLVYEQGHLPRARYTRRVEVPGLVERTARPVVLTSPDGRLARVVAAEVEGAVETLAGGTEAWRAAGHRLEAGHGSLREQPDDRWRAPYQLWDTAAAEGAARAYFGWEHDLEAAVARDDIHRFRIPRPGPPRRIPRARTPHRPDELVDAAHRIGVEATTDAARRDRDREPPAALVAALRDAGVPTLRVPTELGGPGGSMRDTITTMVALATGDPSLAQVMQPHHIAVDRLRLMGDDAARRRHLSAVLDGVLIANASTERGGDRSTMRTRLVPRTDGLGFLLRGAKYYSTGSLVCDELLVLAVDPDDRPVYVVVPRHRPGVELADDWDGFGQRGTASGTSTFEDVPVLAEDVVPLGRWSGVGGDAERHATGSVSQLLHAAIDVGIAAAALRDAVALATTARAAPESGVLRAADDPAVRHTVGRIAHLTHRAEVVVLAAADDVDGAERVDDPMRLEDALVHAALTTAHAKIAANDAALEASSAMFEVAGASGTSSGLDLDRHWRNARTHTLHDPVAHRYRVVGEHLLDGTAPPVSFRF